MGFIHKVLRFNVFSVRQNGVKAAVSGKEHKGIEFVRQGRSLLKHRC